jgi:undecaprenyl diphosphate synthase
MNKPPLSPTPNSHSSISLPAEKMPRHIAIIMDGNGRWAKQKGLPRIEGHRQGADSVRRVTEECNRLGIECLTLYCLSSENWKRPADEIDFLMELLQKYMKEQRENIMKHNVRVSVIGRREGLPQEAIKEIHETVDMSRENTGLKVCLAINYGSRAELVDAMRCIAREVRDGRLDPADIDENTIDAHLYTVGMPEPDLLIRTAGEMRISNFLLWQISYAEIWVTDCCWPDFDENQLHQAINSYAARDRRFGGLSE